MKKYWNILIYFVLIVFIAVSLSFTSDMSRKLLCNDLQIEMKDTLQSGFLSKVDIEKIVLKEESQILGYPIQRINLRKIESQLKKTTYVKEAEVYYDMEGVLHIAITQRKPLLRIMTRYNNSYYIDNEGYIFKPLGGFTPKILVANGSFSEITNLTDVARISDLSESKGYSEWHEVLKLALFINKDKFWNSQIVQIYVDKNGEFELIPRVGAHQIIFGNTDKMEDKLRNLMTLYKQGLQYEGWNKYEKINLKYDNQVICTKR